MSFHFAKRSPLSVSAIILFSFLSIAFWVGFLSKNFWHIRIRGHFYRLFQGASPKSSSTSFSFVKLIHSHCVIYDKSPRTGSSTIANTLRKCWVQLKYKYKRRIQYLVRKNPDTTYIHHALNVTSPKVLVSGEHFVMTKQDVISLATTCQRLFYVTSTRPMQQRILSKAKFESSGGKVFKNTTVSRKDRKRALKKILDVEYTAHSEAFLEKYPFSSSFIIPPDFVIRSSSLRADLRQLLDAFGCRNVSVHSKNIHAYISKLQGADNHYLTKRSDDDNGLEEGESDEIEEVGVSKQEKRDLKKIRLLYGDNRHRQMLRWADRHNRNGLQKAPIFH